MQISSAPCRPGADGWNKEILASPAAEAILQIWKDIFQFDAIGLHSHFFELGGNSLSAGMLQAALKKKFGITIHTADILSHPTVLELAGKIEAAIETSRRDQILATSHNVIPLQPGGEGRPIFVISQSMIFRKLALQLGADQPVYTVLMNHGDSVSRLSSFDEIIDFHLQWIRSVQPSGPYRLAGWCVSGWIAYGIARRLEQQGEEIELLTVIDALAPGSWARCNWRTRLSYNWHRFNTARKKTSIAKLVSKQFVKAEPSPEEKDGDMLDATASQAQFLGSLRGKMLLFCSEEDPIRIVPDSLGWQRILGRPIEVVLVPGDHHKIFDNPGAKIMADGILDVIGQKSEDEKNSSANALSYPVEIQEQLVTTQSFP